MISFKDYLLCELQITDKLINRIGSKFEMAPQDYDSHLVPLLKRFDTQAKRGVLKGPKKDIDTYKFYDDLLAAVEHAEDSLTAKDADRAVAAEGIKVHVDPKFIVVHPTTHAASCRFGKGPQWCIAMDDDPTHYNSYVNEEGMIFLMFLPTNQFKRPHRTANLVTIDDASIDKAIFEYPEAFDWSYDSSSKAIGKYILAAYGQGEEPEPLSAIAGWAPENNVAVAQTREFMRRVMQNWNLNGDEIARDWIDVGGEAGQAAGQAMANFEGDVAEIMPHIEAEGFFGLLEIGWGAFNRLPGARDQNAFDAFVKPIMDNLHKGAGDVGRSEPKHSGRWDKLTVAVKPLRINQSDANWDKGMEFGPYYAEGWDGNNEKIGVDEILKAFDIGPEVVDKMSQYVSEFSFRKIWTDARPEPIASFMRQEDNQTPENIQKADDFFIDRPFEGSSWNWAKTRSSINADTEKHPEWRYGHPDVYIPQPWPELEAKFLQELDDAARERKQIRDWKDKLLTWKGNRELQADIDKEHADKKLDIPSWNNKGLGQGPPEVSQWVNGKYHSWIATRENEITSFLSGHRGGELKGYLKFAKKWNWPELESRLLKKEYAWAGLMQMGTEWIRLGKKTRWKEYEKLLKELWIDSLAPSGRTPNTGYYDRMGMTDKEKITKYGTVAAADEADQDSMVERLRWQGNIETVIGVVKQLKKEYIYIGGHDWTDHSTNLDEKVTDFAPGAWWDDDDTIGLYWNGGIVKQTTPSQKKRGKEPTKYKVVSTVPSRAFFSSSDYPIGLYLDSMPNPLLLDQKGYHGHETGAAQARRLRRAAAHDELPGHSRGEGL